MSLMNGQTDAYIYLATEKVTPLNWHVRRKSLSAETLKWGLYTVAVRQHKSRGRRYLKFLVEHHPIYKRRSLFCAWQYSSLLGLHQREWRMETWRTRNTILDEGG